MTKTSVKLEKFCVTQEEERNGYNVIDLKGYGKFRVEYVHYNRLVGFWYPTPRALAESEYYWIRDLNIAEAPFYATVWFEPRDRDFYHELLKMDKIHVYDLLRNIKLDLSSLNLEY